MGNIVGEGFDPYVIKQIKTRQEILGVPDKLWTTSLGKC